MFGAYARLVIFAAGLLLGIQVPAFVDQYKNRVAAHYLEVSANIAGFQATANGVGVNGARARALMQDLPWRHVVAHAKVH